MLLTCLDHPVVRLYETPQPVHFSFISSSYYSLHHKTQWTPGFIVTRTHWMVVNLQARKKHMHVMACHLMSTTTPYICVRWSLLYSMVQQLTKLNNTRVYYWYGDYKDVIRTWGAGFYLANISGDGCSKLLESYDYLTDRRGEKTKQPEITFFPNHRPVKYT